MDLAQKNALITTFRKSNKKTPQFSVGQALIGQEGKDTPYSSSSNSNLRAYTLSYV